VKVPIIEITNPNGGANLCKKVAATALATPARRENTYFI
jgi:hypothetical protein